MYSNEEKQAVVNSDPYLHTWINIKIVRNLYEHVTLYHEISETVSNPTERVKL